MNTQEDIQRSTVTRKRAFLFSLPRRNNGTKQRPPWVLGVSSWSQLLIRLRDLLTGLRNSRKWQFRFIFISTLQIHKLLREESLPVVRTWESISWANVQTARLTEDIPLSIPSLGPQRPAVGPGHWTPRVQLRLQWSSSRRGWLVGWLTGWLWGATSNLHCYAPSF